MTRTVLITGARGKTGREVARQLATEPDVEVRAGSSRPENTGSGGAAVRSVRFDWQDAETWRDAIAGIDAVYLMRPDLPEAPQMVAELVEFTPDSHVVLVSEQGAEKLGDDHWVRRVENAVTGKAGSWTILRPSWFQQNFIDPRFYRDAIRRDRTLSMPSGGAPIAWVDTRDIAGVAVRALLDPDTHRGRHYTITGPEGVTIPEVAELLSAALEATVTAVEQPLADALYGLDPWIAGVLDDLYRRVKVGDFGGLSRTVETIAGRKPTSLKEFIREHRSEWLQHGSKAAR
ncbi:NAD(P)H-binding protein [Shinella sp. BYT-45]|uniref:NAD(P)H-binding protein n=1 Tax=Shinella sp. BYT-45 TaxID=3377377 RepID=UPI00397FE57D